MVGTWHADGAKIRITGGHISIVEGCPRFFGTWRASWSGLFLADLAGDPVPCPSTNAMETITALGAATRFARDGADRVLSDASARVVLRLTPTDPPVVDPEPAEGPPGPLPDGLVPVTADRLPGTWTPTAGQDAYAQFAADGTVAGSSGCGPDDGRWAVGPAGEFLATTEVKMTFVACPGPPVDHWLADADLAGFDDETLVLLDADGTELGRLVRTG